MLNLLQNNEAVKKLDSLPPLTNNFIYRRYDVMANQSISKSKRICQVEGCNNAHYTKNYCIRHYQQIRKYGKILKRTRSDLNEIIIKDDIAEIILYDAKQREIARAIVDVEDVEKISGFKWYALKDGRTYYAVRSIPIANDKRTLIRMHHQIIGKPPKGLISDHRDGNGLHNFRTNLRHVTFRQNAQNRRRVPKTSQYLGVTWHKQHKKWAATIHINGEKKHLGYFKSEIDAFNAYKNAVHALGETMVGE